ncbi:hypothetical protein KEG38_50340 [Polyangium jinanense]|uniref:hypothetical protein n=1 Tax=Polyangium jinanense TaxID=2829994 RepID=UPI00233FA8A7|nr:hypothetical protein [Polyangium jinanense]MDC3962119.1 hypothetical protein [Polyangium jinanense]
MEMPPEDTPPEAYLPRSAYSIARVAADPKTAGLELALAAIHVDFKKILRDREDHEEEVEKRSAVLDARDNELDEDIGGFELGLLALVTKNRGDARYRRYFPEGLRQVTTAEPRKEEPELVGDMLDSMTEDMNDPELGSLVATWAPKISNSRSKVLAASENLALTEKELALLNDKRIPALMAAWRTEYKKLEGQLTAVYASNPKMVDRFFKPFRKRSKAKKTDR